MENYVEVNHIHYGIKFRAI